MTAPRFTIFTADKGTLNKRFDVVRTPDGPRIRKGQGAANLYSGKAETVEASTPAELAQILDNLTPAQAAGQGILKQGRGARITTAAKVSGDAVSRSLDHFTFPKGAGWALWDYDDKDISPAAAQKVAELGGPVAALFSIWPEARAGSFLIRPSSSDGIAAPGCAPIASTGVHGWFLIADATRAKELAETLHARAWAAGLGWTAISKSGALLSRSIIDVSVASPERLIFEAAPTLGQGVTQTRRRDVLHNGQAIPLPENGGDLFTQARRAETADRHRIKPQAEKVEREHIEGRAQSIAQKTGASLEQAREIVRQTIKGKVLDDDTLLELRDGSTVRVGDVLDNPERWHRVAIPDPIEGLEYGADNASLFTLPGIGRDGRKYTEPRLISHAHGHVTVYRFARYQPAPNPPTIPGPKGDRAAQLARVKPTIKAHNRAAFRDARARRAVAQAFAERLPQTRAEKLAIRQEVQRNMRLDHLPGPEWSKSHAGPRNLITGGQGIGKTAAFVGLKIIGDLHRATGLTGAFYSPDHGKNAENFETYKANAPAGESHPIPVHVKGRSAVTEDGQGHMCELHLIAETAAKNGVNVRDAMCANCPFRAGCQYLDQERQIKEAAQSDRGAVLFLSHDFAALTIPGAVTVDYFAFDERPRDNFHRTAHVSFEALGRDLRPNLNWAGMSAGEAQDKLTNLLTRINPLRTILRRAMTDHPATALDWIEAETLGHAPDDTPADTWAAAARGITDFLDHTLANAIAAEMQAAERAATFGGQSVDIHAKLAQAIKRAAIPNGRKLIAIFEAVARDLDNGHGPRLTSLYSTGQGITATYLAPVTIPKHAPLIVLDGTGDATLHRAHFGDLDHHHLPVERLGDAVFIEGTAFATCSITGQTTWGSQPVPYFPETAEILRAKIESGIACHPNFAVIAAKDAIERLNTGDRKTGHFNAIRGRNFASTSPGAIVIGRIVPRVFDLEKLARAYAAALGEPFTALADCADIDPADTRDGQSLPKRAEYLRMRDGTGHPVTVQFHPDPTAQAVLRQIRDAEATQAADRCRPHFEAKTIVIAGACVPDVTFDRVTTLNAWAKGGTPLERIAREAGFIPFSPAELVRLFPCHLSKSGDPITPEAGKKWAQRDEQYQSLIAQATPSEAIGDKLHIDTICEMSPIGLASLVTYQKAGATGRGKASITALVFTAPGDARATVEAVAGPLDAFTIIAMTEAAELADTAAERAAIQAESAQEPPDRTGDVWGDVCPFPAPQIATETPPEERRALVLATGPP